ncbi:uncharacterized protein wu:fy63c09 isoform X2 [Triplophysa dalaica]|uniref:uncharacterized protein wu:fy63c09 isoform X2 n=1 Tax=Triplophysa dalaica TaxID=1582913 RepID=UPI0024DF3840|nr:uncharacterized protein wu:fy63c09 isoform X2 [Triplophysa dalaica]
MAEARAEEEDERLREPAGARRRVAEHSDRNKPDQRLSSSGALSSIRAAIKRTSTRTSSQSDLHRDRRRPEITILSAEPLPNNAWFPGASGAFPPAPPPAPPSWSAASGSVQLPPPSYEQVIKEKTREQNLPSTSSSPSPQSSRRSTSTIATQTDTDSPDPQSPAARPVLRPMKPPRPSLPLKHTTSPQADPFIDSDGSETRPQTRDVLRQPEQRDAQTDSDDVTCDVKLIDSAPPVRMSTQSTLDFRPEPMREEPSVRPRPRPRSRISLQATISEEVLDQPMTREVKVQTLVRLKDDGAESPFAGFSDDSTNFSSKYMQDLLEVFGCEDANEHEDRQQNEEETSIISAVPSEPLNRPQPRPRTQKPKPLLPPKPSRLESDVFEPEEPSVKPDPSKQSCSAPVPAPRPLLNKHHSPSHEHHMKDSTSSSEYKNPPTPPEKTPVTPNVDHIVNQPSIPRHSRPPPPLHRNMSSTSQVSVSVTGVSQVTGASVPSLPPRPSGGRLLPLRPPSIKLAKSPGPASANQLPASRVPKRGPPLPPRPKAGHPLYKIYSRKIDGGLEMENVGEPQEEPCSLEEEEHLIDLEDSSSDPLCHVSLTPEVKGEDVSVCDDLWRDSCAHVQTHSRCVAGHTFTGEVGELTFSEGDVITLMEYVNEEWGRGCLNGQIGIFPLNFVKVETEALPKKPSPGGERKRGSTLYDFSPECEDELCLKAGDVVCDLEDMDDEWFLGELGGRRGLVPKNYIQVLPET